MRDRDGVRDNLHLGGGRGDVNNNNNNSVNCDGYNAD